jgi:hypothetical protein
MENTMWSHLPNAVYIDRVLASLKANPKSWADALNAAYDAGRDDDCHAAWEAAWDTAYDTAYDAVRSAYDAACDADHHLTRNAACDAITALIAYDDSAKYLNMPLDQLKMLYVLTEHPACLLLQPAAQAFAMEQALA